MFAGIGGFRSGLTRAGGFRCVGHCEIDKYANASYQAIYEPGKEERYYPDATQIDPADLPDFDLLSAITESGLDNRAMPAVFLGGGAAMLKRNVSAADGLCRPVILDDVSLNAKGYERLAERLTKNDE